MVTKTPKAKAPAKKAPAKKPKPARGAAKAEPRAARATPKTSPSKGKTVAWYASTLPAWQRELLRALGALIAEVAPKATSSIKWAQPVWEHQGPFAWARGHKSHVSVGLWRGAELDDADGILEGEGDRMRHVKIREGEALPAALRALMKAAAERNERHGDPTKRG